MRRVLILIVVAGLILAGVFIGANKEGPSSTSVQGLPANQFFDWCFVEGSVEEGLVPAFKSAERIFAEAGFQKEIAAYTRRCVNITYELTVKDFGAAFGGTFIKVNPVLKGDVKREAYALVHEIVHAWDYYKEKGYRDCISQETTAFFTEYKVGLWDSWYWVGTDFEAQIASKKMAERHCNSKY